jgi:hypothetical protein
MTTPTSTPTSLASPTRLPGEAPDAPPSRTMWRIAGGLALAHILIMLAAITQESLVEHGASAATVRDSYGGANLTRVLGATYFEALSFLVLTPAIVFAARALGRRTPTSRWAGQTFLALGVAYVASTLAVGFPPGAAAIYGSQHGADLASVAMVNDIRNYGFFLQLAISCGMAVALGVAALNERVFTRWIGWGGVAFGVAGLVAIPFAPNAVSMAWLVWWVGLAVLFLRGGPKRV